MSRTTDSLKYLFGRTGSYIDETGVKKPLPYDKKFLKKFFKSRLIDRLIKEGTNVFDVSRFAPVTDYIDKLHIVYNTDGTIKEASITTNAGNVIDCYINVQIFYAMLYVTAGAKASDTDEWLGNNADTVVYYDKRASYTGTASWNAGRSIDGMDAVAYYYKDGTTTGICCETTDGNTGTFKLAQNMLYHLFNGANVEVIEGFSNAISKMVWGDNCAYMDGTFENVRTTNASASEVTLNLGWMINKWHCASSNFSTFEDKPLNISWPANLQGIDTTNTGYTIWINAILTNDCWVNLANNLATHGDADTWKATIKVETAEQAVNLLDEVKQAIEQKGWTIDIPVPVETFFTKINLPSATGTVIGMYEYGGIEVAVTTKEIYWKDTTGTWINVGGLMEQDDDGIFNVYDVRSCGVDDKGNLFIHTNDVDKVTHTYSWLNIASIYNQKQGLIFAKKTISKDMYNAEILDYKGGVILDSYFLGTRVYVTTTGSSGDAPANHGTYIGEKNGVLLADNYLFVYADASEKFGEVGSSPFDENLTAVAKAYNKSIERIAKGKNIIDLNMNTFEITTVKENLAQTKIDGLGECRSMCVYASGGKVYKQNTLNDFAWTGTFEDTGLTYTKTIKFTGSYNDMYAIADGILYKATIE